MKRWGLIALGVVVVAGIAFAATTLIEDRQAQQQYEAQVAGCERGNVLRTEVNSRGEDLRTYASRVAANPAVPADVRWAAKELYRDTEPVEIADCPALFPAP